MFSSPGGKQRCVGCRQIIRWFGFSHKNSRKQKLNIQVPHVERVVLDKLAARLVPINADVEWKPFTGTHEHLKTMPPWRGGKPGEELIRADRDERG